MQINDCFSNENQKKEPEKKCATQEAARGLREKRSGAELTVADLFKFWDMLADYDRRKIKIRMDYEFINDAASFVMYDEKNEKTARVDISRMISPELTVKRVLDDLEIRLRKENER